jgi:hypothetical protein
MYENLKKLHVQAADFLTNFEPSDGASIEAMKREYPACPQSYARFLYEVGQGFCDEGELHFEFFDGLKDAERDSFFDDQIYQFGAKGAIKLFGTDMCSSYFGFDTGQDWKLVEVTADHYVETHNIDFKSFVEGMFVCAPYMPIKHEDGIWYNAAGEQYTVVK